MGDVGVGGHAAQLRPAARRAMPFQRISRSAGSTDNPYSKLDGADRFRERHPRGFQGTDQIRAELHCRGRGGSASSTPNSRPDGPRPPPEGPWSAAPRESSESPTSSGAPRPRALPGSPRALQLRPTGRLGQREPRGCARRSVRSDESQHRADRKFRTVALYGSVPEGFMLLDFGPSCWSSWPCC